MSEHERHLTEEMLLRVQMGDPASEAERAHLESCAECRQQVEPLNDALRWFGAAAREFGAEKAAAPRSARVVAHTWSGLSWGLGRGLAAACCVLLILLAVTIPRWQQHRAAVAALAQQQRQQQLTEDDALLEEVDQDVSQEVPEAMQPLSWNSSSSAGSAKGNTATRQ